MKAFKTAGLIVCILTALASLVAGMAFYRDTVVDWWLPPLFAAIVGAALAPWLRGFISRVTPMSDRVYTTLSAFIFSGSLVYGITLTANSVFADRDDARDCDAEVVDRHVEQRTRYRRVGRGRMTPAGHYNAYCVTVSLPDGRLKTYETSRSRYNAVRSGSHFTLSVCPGLLGYDIILNSRL